MTGSDDAGDGGGDVRRPGPLRRAEGAPLRPPLHLPPPRHRVRGLQLLLLLLYLPFSSVKLSWLAPGLLDMSASLAYSLRGYPATPNLRITSVDVHFGAFPVDTLRGEAVAAAGAPSPLSHFNAAIGALVDEMARD